jgi:superfamily I DNA and/or RNA helicase
MRYADVIGATCIGVETIEGLEDLDFDLAIVDEAGQICLPDLLVPLARADRAVLVGDHQQLPPFVANEVRDWLNSLVSQEEEVGNGMDSDAIATLLTHSAFELLFADASRNQRLVRLTRQFRMPQIIADFASEHFYNRQLFTEHPEKVSRARHTDPLFLSPLALIDTAATTRRQGEQRMRATENWATEGYINKIEARLITDLALYYEQANMRWVIIVPYRSQARHIITLLQNKLSATVLRWEERVSTVDSFQGSECEKVIYGFTRSNPRGEVGFLTELRRLNVAMTRAKEQLIVVGDFSTLTNATNLQFQSLIRALYQQARRYGEVLSYEQCQHRVSLKKAQE